MDEFTGMKGQLLINIKENMKGTVALAPCFRSSLWANIIMDCIYVSVFITQHPSDPELIGHFCDHAVCDRPYVPAFRHLLNDPGVRSHQGSHRLGEVVADQHLGEGDTSSRSASMLALLVSSIPSSLSSTRRDHSTRQAPPSPYNA